MTERILVKRSKFDNAELWIYKLTEGVSRTDAVNGVRDLFLCHCGTLFVANRYAVRYGNTRSCGCLLGDGNKKSNSGYVQHSLYYRWNAMKKRCHSPNIPKYKYYGARGIEVCKEWRDDFGEYAKYIDEVLGPQPSPTHSLDRIDNNKNYEPGNLRWATKREQSQNTRQTRHEFDNAVVSRKRVLARIKSGWSIEEATTIPIGQKRQVLR